MANTTATIRSLSDGTIVRIPDGRVGYILHNTGGKLWVMIEAGQLSTEVDRSLVVEVVATPG